MKKPRCVSVFVPAAPFGSPVELEILPGTVDDFIIVDDRVLALGSLLLDITVVDDPKFLVYDVEDCELGERLVG